MTQSHDPKNKVQELKKMLSGKNKPAEEPAVSSVAPPAASSQPELELFQKDLQAAQDEAKQNYDKLLRAMADFENYKKRVSRDQEDLMKYGNERLIKELLPVLDDLDRVLAHLPENPSEEVQGLAQGVEIVQKHFLTALQKCGVTQIESLRQPFDPHWHEAMGHVVTEEVAPGTIMSEHRKGYRLQDRLLRPALVSVAKEGESN